MKKVKIPKKVQNELLKIMAANQNSVKKLNAGQLREAQSLTIAALFKLPLSSRTDVVKAVIESIMSEKPRFKSE